MCFYLLIVIFFSYQRGSIADDIWPLHDNSSEMSDDEEIELGTRVDEYIKNRFYVGDGDELTKRLNDITRKIADVSNRRTLPFVCGIIQSPSINAFSAPGGYIYITDGLLIFTKSEDEVAGIIGHEIAHACHRHISKLYYHILEMSSHADKEDDANAGLLWNTHLKEFEQEADSTGVFYAYKAGFDPHGLPDFLERQLSVMLQNRVFSFMNFHLCAIIRSRIDLVRKYISTLEKEETHESND